MSFGGELLGAFVVVAKDAHANPPIAGRAGEAQNFGGAIAAREVPREFSGSIFMGKSANLNGPFSAGSEGSRRLHDFDANFRDTGLIDIELVGGGEREIDDASGDERAAIGDAHENRVICLEIGDAHDRSERQRTVCGGHGVHVVDFAVRSATGVIGRSVPTGESGLRCQRDCAGGNSRFSETGAGISS